MSGEPDVLKVAPPKDRRVRVEEVDGDLELSYRRRLWGVACFVLLWLTGWSAACVFLVRQAITDPGVGNILFAIPFVAGWFVVTFVLIWMFFGAERVRLGFEGLEYRATALLTLIRRTVPRAELKGVSAGLTAYQVSYGNEPARSEPCLKFETMSQPVPFAGGISEEEQRWLVERLNEYLDTLGPHGPPNRYGAAPNLIPQTSRGEALQTEVIPVEPPSDSRIEMHPHADTMEFVWQGEWSLTAIAAMTFVTLFWNGIVGIFVYHLIQEFHWFEFIILIPHEVVGLVFCALWLVTLTALLWRWTWTFGEHRITRRLSVSDANAVVFAMGWSKRFRIQPPVRIELRRREGEKKSGSLAELLSHPDGEYNLSFLGADDKELLALNRLTEGDARWIADVLLCAFPSWSPTEETIC
jgi:hypothetical protein